MCRVHAGCSALESRAPFIWCAVHLFIYYIFFPPFLVFNSSLFCSFVALLFHRVFVTYKLHVNYVKTQIEWESGSETECVLCI